MLISRKTKIVMSASEPRLQGLFAQGELANQYFGQRNFGDLLTADHKVFSEGSESRNIIDTQSWYKNYLPNGFSRTRAKTKTSQETRRSLRKFLEPSEKMKVIFLTIRWNCANPVKIYHGILLLQHTIDPRRMELLKEQCAEKQKGRLLYCCSQDWMKRWWVDSTECFCHVQNVQDHLAVGKTPYEKRFGEPFKGPLIPLGAMVEYHPISAKDRSRLHQSGKKVLPGVFLRYALIAGWNCGKDIRTRVAAQQAAGTLPWIGVDDPLEVITVASRACKQDAESTKFSVGRARETHLS